MSGRYVKPTSTSGLGLKVVASTSCAMTVIREGLVSTGIKQSCFFTYQSLGGAHGHLKIYGNEPKEIPQIRPNEKAPPRSWLSMMASSPTHRCRFWDINS